MSLTANKLRTAPPRLLAALYRAGMSEDAIRRAYYLDATALARAISRPPEPLRVADMALLPDDGYRHELREGELVRMSPTKLQHAESAGILVMHLGAYLIGNPLGRLYVGEGGFQAGPDETLYCPDAAYISAERRSGLQPGDFIPFAPDIAIEVWSPENTAREMNRKAADYCAHGSQLVWVLRPQDKTVRVHRPNAPVQILNADDFLTGEDVLPGFSVRVGDLFP